MIRSAWLLLAGAMLAGPAAARSYQYDDIKAVYVDQIRHVVTCGTWQHGDAAGTYRVLEAEIHAQSVLFVQWLDTPDPATGLRAVRASYGPALLNDDHADISLSELRCHARDDGIRVTAQAYSGHDGRWRRLCLLASHAPGAAQLEFGPDRASR